MIIRYRKMFYGISGALVLVSVILLILWGLNFGIDFTGGSLIEITFTGTRPPHETIAEAMRPRELGEVTIQQTGSQGYLLRTRALDETAHQAVLTALRGTGEPFVEKRFDSVGPRIGDELKKKSITALLLVVSMIILYIAWAFRKVTAYGGAAHHVSSWKYGIIAIVALAHDVIIPTGVFAFLGRYHGVEVNALFVTALLTILGFSVHDTIVVFDRVRENLKRKDRESFENIVDMSIRETLVRSLNTSLTILLALSILFIFGSNSTRFFALALIIGIFFGTYSSLFVASPLLVTWEKWSNRVKSS